MSKPHSFTNKLHTLHWLYCARCGLILLNNKATKKAAQKSCDESEVKAAPEWVRNK